MNWIEIALVGAVFVGLACGAALVARSPTFWVGITTVAIKAAFPYIWLFVSKRMTPEEERAWRHDQSSGVEKPQTGVTTSKTITQPAATTKSRPRP